MFKFREIDQCEVGEIVRCLPDKKFAWLSGSRYCADHTQSLPGPALDSVLSAPDFIQIGSLSVELSRTPEHRRNGSGRKVFPICLFGWSLASSRITIIVDRNKSPFSEQFRLSSPLCRYWWQLVNYAICFVTVVPCRLKAFLYWHRNVLLHLHQTLKFARNDSQLSRNFSWSLQQSVNVSWTETSLVADWYSLGLCHWMEWTSLSSTDLTLDCFENLKLIQNLLITQLSPVLTATGLVNGKGQFSTPQNRHQKFVTGDYVGDPYRCAKFHGDLSNRT